MFGRPVAAPQCGAVSTARGIVEAKPSRSKPKRSGGGDEDEVSDLGARWASRTLDPMRVPRTFVFADLSGFTNYTAEHGDDAAAFLLSAFRGVAREVASDRGVRIAKWLGDGCMIVAVDHADGVAAALDLDERARKVCAPLALRVGVASGYSLLFEGDDYIGLAVNLAARLCDAAGPYEVLMPAEQVDD